MKRYVIERDIPDVEKLEGPTLKGAAATSNQALAALAPKVQWVQSYVTKGKTFCVYLADGEDTIREHSKLSGFPASKITEVARVIDPTTGG